MFVRALFCLSWHLRGIMAGQVALHNYLIAGRTATHQADNRHTIKVDDLSAAPSKRLLLAPLTEAIVRGRINRCPFRAKRSPPVANKASEGRTRLLETKHPLDRNGISAVPSSLQFTLTQTVAVSRRRWKYTKPFDPSGETNNKLFISKIWFLDTSIIFYFYLKRFDCKVYDIHFRLLEHVY